MRAFAIVALCLLALANAGRFGPKECISVTRSAEGTCMLATNCNGHDTSKIEFAFNCEKDDPADKEDIEITRHSYGFGGFDANEDFDTQVKCTRCTPPSSSTPSKPPAPKEDDVEHGDALPKAVPAEEEEEEEEPQRALPVQTLRLRSKRASAQASHSSQSRMKRVKASAPTKAAKTVSFRARRAGSEVKYGPDGCVKTWKSEKGHCMMETSCTESNMTGYNYGLVCVDKVGAPTRHLFGTGSFLAEETFNTLISCDQCLGLEEIPHEVGLTGEILALSKDVKHLNQMMKNMSINLDMLNDKVFDGEVPTTWKVAAAPAPAAAPSVLIHHKAAHRKHHHHAASGAHRQVKEWMLKHGDGVELAAQEKHSQHQLKHGLRNGHHHHHGNKEHEHKRSRHHHQHKTDDTHQ